MTEPPPGAPLQLDKRLVRRSFDAAAADYDEHAVLQHEVGSRMFERFDLVRIDPSDILDAGAGTGRFVSALETRYRAARVIALDLSPAMLRAARARRSWLARWRRPAGFICGDVESLPFADASFDLLFSNLTLQWCNDLRAALAEFRRVLRPNGLLMFTTFGPDSLRELRESWAGLDANTHTNGFIDMHDVGDTLMQVGFREPVMDVEHFTLTYPDVRALMRDLKSLGAHNVTLGRPRGLMGKARLNALIERYERLRQDGRLPATYEVVYGHAWSPTSTGHTKRGRENQSVHVPLSQLARPRQD